MDTIFNVYCCNSSITYIYIYIYIIICAYRILFGTSQLYVYRVPAKKDTQDLIPSLLFEEALEVIAEIEEKRDSTISITQLFEGAMLSDKGLHVVQANIIKL